MADRLMILADEAGDNARILLLADTRVCDGASWRDYKLANFTPRISVSISSATRSRSARRWSLPQRKQVEIGGYLYLAKF
ncbi:Uncharacterised protein [Corynebacterium jeikeium]|nr:Uncharacterised protein [Corynebacterium jeikeium]